MTEQLIVLYTMMGCPYCVMIKEQLNKLGIPYIERDIYEEDEEFDLFVHAVDGNDSVPAFMIIETDGKTHDTKFYTSERDYYEIDQAVKIIKESHQGFKLK